MAGVSGGLNPFYFREGLKQKPEANTDEMSGLNPFYFREGLKQYQRKIAAGEIVLIPFISGKV